MLSFAFQEINIEFNAGKQARVPDHLRKSNRIYYYE